ncbi:UMP-CMP kinase [Coemansia erecta]|uniref:UMP-CMP kinase n=1 Tax=Coemansia erecta TaxID=147472 RepID=A0A9W8CNV7_9FUNG|nr:UMP-CMP kinase [Coemansia erecta]
MSAAPNPTRPQRPKVRSDCVISSPAAVPFRVPASFSGSSTPLATPRSAGARSSASLHAQRNPGRPMFIGIGGGRGSGKEHTCRNIIDTLRRLGHAELADRVVHLHLDDFHRVPSAAELEQLRLGNEQINLDHPESFDFELLHGVLGKLGAGEHAEVPVWDRGSLERTGWRAIECSPRVVLVEGTLVLFGREVRECLDMQVFLDVDSDTRLGRQVRAAIEADAQVDLKRFLDRYLFVAKPSFEEFVWPTKRWADVIIPKGDRNGVAIELIAQRLIDLGQDP